MISVKIFKFLLIKRHLFNPPPRWFCQKNGMTERQNLLMASKLPKKHKLTDVENVILIASAKGGVGKSTTAVNLALSLLSLNNGHSVGLLDTDVFGPSIPKMMNLSGKPLIDDDENMIPLVNYGIKCMSMGFLVDENDPIVWRGPMVMSAIQRLLLRTAWGKLKYLVLDMPPGTGDVQLSISQLISINGAIIVSTPQDIALLDARRGIEMFHKVNIPVLGLIQNMSTYICPNCGHEEHIFGHGGAHKMASNQGVPFLGDIGLHRCIRQGADEGLPIVASSINSQQGESYAKIARFIQEVLSKSTKYQR